jgi:hypothetical protein
MLELRRYLDCGIAFGPLVSSGEAFFCLAHLIYSANFIGAGIPMKKSVGGGIDPFADAKPRLSILMNRKRFMSTGAPTDVSPWSFGAGTRSEAQG